MDWTLHEIEMVEKAIRPPGKHAPARPLPPSPHGTLASGFQDYQGYPLTRLSGVTMESVDFSRARSPKNEYGQDRFILLSFVICENVFFDQAGLFSRIDGTFRNCRFREIRTSGVGLTGTFEGCDFTGANLRRAMLGANFRECHFNGANMRVDGWGASFRNCTFADAKIDDLFADIREFVGSGQPVTFSVLIGGFRPGVAVQM
jgi:uncharacterized protein YjbI with pentapeptide repeats